MRWRGEETERDREWGREMEREIHTERQTHRDRGRENEKEGERGGGGLKTWNTERERKRQRRQRDRHRGGSQTRHLATQTIKPTRRRLLSVRQTEGQTGIYDTHAETDMETRRSNFSDRQSVKVMH